MIIINKVDKIIAVFENKKIRGETKEEILRNTWDDILAMHEQNLGPCNGFGVISQKNGWTLITDGSQEIKVIDW